jgi:hypothetical protein
MHHMGLAACRAQRFAVNRQMSMIGLFLGGHNRLGSFPQRLRAFHRTQKTLKIASSCLASTLESTLQ